MSHFRFSIYLFIYVSKFCVLVCTRVYVCICAKTISEGINVTFCVYKKKKKNIYADSFQIHTSQK